MENAPKPFVLRHPSTLIFIGCLALFTLAITILSEGFGLGVVSTSLIKTLGKTLCLCLVALAMDLVWGYTGILSLGHMAFFGIGGYAIGMWLMYARTEIIVANALAAAPLPPTAQELTDGIAGQIFGVVGASELPPIWAFAHSLPLQLAAVILVPGAIALIFGWLAFRSRVTGVYLSILTQAMTLALALYLFQNDSGLRGNNGLSGLQNLPGLESTAQSSVSIWFFWASALALGAGYLLCAWVVSGKFGSVLRAIRDDEARVRFLGYSSSSPSPPCSQASQARSTIPKPASSTPPKLRQSPPSTSRSGSPSAVADASMAQSSAQPLSRSCPHGSQAAKPPTSTSASTPCNGSTGGPSCSACPSSPSPFLPRAALAACLI
jgi:urea ABC transporter permease protein UrtC